MSSLKNWMSENASLFSYLGDLKDLKGSAEAILLSGDASSLLAGALSSLYKTAKITAVLDDSEVIKDLREESDSILIKDRAFTSVLDQNCSYDIAISALQVEKLDTRELTPYLFDLYDCLNCGGVLYLSFPDAVRPTVMRKNLYPSYYDPNILMPYKYYMAGDVINALSLIGFRIKATESNRNDDLLNVITLIAEK